MSLAYYFFPVATYTIPILAWGHCTGSSIIHDTITSLVLYHVGALFFLYIDAMLIAFLNRFAYLSYSHK